MEATTVASVLTAAKTLTSLVRNLSETVKGSDKSEMQGQVIELQTAMMDLLSRQQELIRENGELTEKVTTLTKELTRKKSIEKHYGLYWIREDENTLEGPYSPQMYEIEDRLVSMHVQGRGTYGGGIRGFHFMCLKTEENTVIPDEFMEENNIIQLKQTPEKM